MDGRSTLSPGAGSLLVALPSLADPNFARTVVYLFGHDDEDGTIGVILNRPSPLTLQEHLPEMADRTVAPPVVFIGGPVQREIAVTVCEGIDGPLIINSDDQVGFDRCRVYSGYSGWGVGQLEAELTEGAWLVVPSAPDDIFCSDPDDLWSAVLRRQGGRIGLMASYPRDVSAN